MNHTSLPFVSVIIPVYNEQERLKKCLSALEEQTYPKNLYEVIVVDNASKQDIKSVVKQFGQALTTYESRPGSYIARNQAISLAKGEVLAFTDADCIPAPDWIETGVINLLHHPNCGLVAGKIELFFKNPSKPTIAELYDSFMVGFPQHEFVQEGFGATANLFTFRQVMDKVGGFDGKLKSSGDKEWGQRVHAAGYELCYADDTCVAHPARDSWQELCKKTTRIVGGHLDLDRKRGYSTKDFIKDIAKDLLPPFRLYFRIWSDQRLKSKKQKLQYICLTLTLKYLTAWEKIRLQLGGESVRS